MTSYPYPANSRVVDAFVPDQLELPGAEIVMENATFLAGEELFPGAVIGRVTASGKWKLSLAAAGDGSEVPRGVMREYVKCVDKTGANKDMTGTVARRGYFNEDRLILGTGHTVASIRVALADKGIHLRKLGYSG